MHTTRVLAACLAIGVSVASTNAWVNRGEEPVKGPYKVVISKQITTLGGRAVSSYEEHEYLTEMWNQLDKDGLKPLMTQMFSQATNSPHLSDTRMVVVCIPK